MHSSIELDRLRPDERRGLAPAVEEISAHGRIVAALYARFRKSGTMTSMPPQMVEEFEAQLRRYPSVTLAEAFRI
jgi:hypothetical protein